MEHRLNSMDLKNLKIIELKQELDKRGLPKSGKKQELITRLSSYLEAESLAQDPVSSESSQHDQPSPSQGSSSEKNDEVVTKSEDPPNHFDADNSKPKPDMVDDQFQSPITIPIDVSGINTTGTSFHTVPEDSPEKTPPRDDSDNSSCLSDHAESTDNIKIHAEMSDEELCPPKHSEVIKMSETKIRSSEQTLVSEVDVTDDKSCVLVDRKQRKRGQRWGMKKTRPAPVITSKSIDEMLPEKKSACELDAIVKERMEQMRQEGGSVSDEEEGEIAEDASDVSDNSRLGSKHPPNADEAKDESELLRERRESGEIDEDLSTHSTGRSSLPKADASKDKKPKRLRLRETKVVGYSVDDPIRTNPPRKAVNPASNIVKIIGLVRPFTANQLKELLTKFGPLRKESPESKSFWLDKIKTRSLAIFDNLDDAKSAREELDNCKWPRISPRELVVDFCSQEEFDWMVMHGDTGKPLPKHFKLANQDSQNSEADSNLQTDKPLKRAHPPDSEEPIAHKAEKPSHRSPSPPHVKRPLKDSNQRSRRRSSVDDRAVRDSHRQRHEEPHSPDRRRERSRSPADERSKNEKPARLPAKEDHEPEVLNSEKPRPEKTKDEQPGRLLDQLFFKTKTTPFIYWMPLTDEEIQAKEKRMDKVAIALSSTNDTHANAQSKPEVAKQNQHGNSKDFGSNKSGNLTRTRSEDKKSETKRLNQPTLLAGTGASFKNKSSKQNHKNVSRFKDNIPSDPLIDSSLSGPPKDPYEDLFSVDELVKEQERDSQRMKPYLLDKRSVKLSDEFHNYGGELILSSHGGKEPDSKIHYFPRFLKPAEADSMYHMLMLDLEWQDKKIHGQNLKVAWFGPSSNFAGFRFDSNLDWHPLLSEMKLKVSDYLKAPFDSVFCVHYESGMNFTNWYSEEEDLIRASRELPIGVSLHLGCPRPLELKASTDHHRFHYLNTSGHHLHLDARHGSLFVTEGSTLFHWNYRVPIDPTLLRKLSQDKDGEDIALKSRIVLTFRYTKIKAKEELSRSRPIPAPNRTSSPEKTRKYTSMAPHVSKRERERRSKERALKVEETHFKKRR